ncbi:unnamed protein product [Chilo suppressalis]|uniref:FAD-dependent oxidoreductase domain-containing protein 1 n=1 Tax=Chilo suppressalis TaxID=168631 RepID=A0ABN8LAL1_CHISP|nr:unnamed protein product [Chilo suppressalis]
MALRPPVCAYRRGETRRLFFCDASLFTQLARGCQSYSVKLNCAIMVFYVCIWFICCLLVELQNWQRPFCSSSGEGSNGCTGIESEGTFNSLELLKGLVNKAQALGSVYINAEVVGFELEKQRDVLMEGVLPGSFERINKVIYKTPDNEEHSIKFAACVLAAGDNSGNIAQLAKIGTCEGLLSIPLPIEKREYNVYSIKDKAKDMGLKVPIVTDTSGLWLQRNGLDSNLLCGHVPLVTEETKDLSGEEYYANVIKPPLINRIQNCENAEVTLLTMEKQDINTFDYSGIIGPHPYHNNLYIATGFGKQGCLHAPGIGRAIAELIVDSQYSKIDLSRLCFDRILMNEPLVEFNIY